MIISQHSSLTQSQEMEKQSTGNPPTFIYDLKYAWREGILKFGPFRIKTSKKLIIGGEGYTRLNGAPKKFLPS